MRIARLIVPTVFHHVISRFVDRDWYFNDKVERDRYLHYLGRAVERSDWSCVAFALMSNHIHLGLIAGMHPLEPLIKRVHAPFARWMNQRRGRLGALFADRPSSWAIRPEHVAATIAYIHANPVRAGVVEDARYSTWTSYRAYVGDAPAPGWLNVTDGLARSSLDLDGLAAETARHIQPSAKLELARIHHEAHKRGAIELATPAANPIVVPLVSRPFARLRPDPREVLNVVGAILKVDPHRFASRSPDPACVRARCVAVHVGRSVGLTGSAIAAALGITRQSASQIASRPLDSALRAAVVLACSHLTSFPPSPAKVAQ